MDNQAKTVIVWDWVIRVFHWTLVALIICLWWTAEEGMMDWHRRLGLLTLGVMVMRLYWGIVGPHTARFAHFVKGPSAILTYLGQLKQAPYKPSFGHNPLGALSVIALLGTIMAQVVFGLFAVDVDGMESGPLSRLVDFETGRQFAELHELTFNLLLILIGLHVLAVLGYAILLKVNLVNPMFTGRSDVIADGEGLPAPMRLSVWKVIIGLVLSVGCVLLIARI